MALWNAMVDTPETLKDFNRLNGSQPLILMLNIGTSLGRELSAGAIWKVSLSLTHSLSLALSLPPSLPSSLPLSLSPLALAPSRPVALARARARSLSLRPLHAYRHTSDQSGNTHVNGKRIVDNGHPCRQKSLARESGRYPCCALN